MNSDAELTRLKKVQENLIASHNSVLAKIEMEKQKYLETLLVLKELGCNSVGEAKIKISQLEEQLETEIAEIKKILE
jgi:hypothetical protein